MFDIANPPKSDCRVLLTYVGGVIINVRTVEDDEQPVSAKNFSEFALKHGWQMVSVLGISSLQTSIEYWRNDGAISDNAAQQLTERLSNIVNGEG